jgi:CHAT domain-containing protein/tetratricopeptide (TPR) repeat protein
MLSRPLLKKLGELGSDAGRKKLLRGRRKLLRSEAIAELTQAANDNLHVNTRLALHWAEAAVFIARQLKNKDDLGRSLRARANCLWVLGENRKSVSLHERALRIFVASQNEHEEARTLSASLQPLILLGEYDRAFAFAERARKIFIREGETLRLASLENNVGNIFHRQDRFEEALAHYERAYVQLLSLQDSERLAMTLSNMAMCLISLNDFPRALESYRGARKLFEEKGLPLAVNQADYNIAYLYYFRGEYGRSIQMLRATRDESRRNGDAYHFALCHLDLSEIYLELNLSEEARQMAHEGQLQFQKLGMGYEAAKTLANEAIAYGQQGMAFRSLELFPQARALFAKEKNLVWPWLIDLYQALVLFNEGRLFEARRLCSAAAKFFDSSILSGKAVLCHLLLSRLALRNKEVKEAKRECGIALQRLAGLEAPVLEYQAHFLLGQIHESAADHGNAYAAYQKARTALETLRSSLKAEELKIAFMKNRLEVYERLVEICLRDSARPESLEEAFGYIEQAKSRNLMELILQSGSSMPPEETTQSDLVRRIQDLREELNWYYHRIEHEQLKPEQPSPARIEKLRNEAKDRENNLLRTLRELPEGGAQSFALPAAACASLKEIRASLLPDAAIVEYFAVGDRLVAAVVTRERLRIVPVTVLSRIRTALRLFRLQLSKFQVGADYVQTFRQALLETTLAHLRELYGELIAPLREDLAVRHLVVVPHGVLHYLPFHALYDGEKHLIDTFTISYAPSATIFALCQQKPDPAAKSSLVLGVPDERAPFIADEVLSVAALLPHAGLFLGSEASERVLREKGAQSRLIHIATHGNFRQDNPMFSGIRLGDSYLSLHDLYRLRLDADLVTLSGCATGLNVVAAGYELLGLIRGFISAGARSLLLSLWDVHDRTAAELMKGFYRRFCGGQDKATALQGAMQELREQHPHPYYWAPFMLVGKTFPS